MHRKQSNEPLGPVLGLFEMLDREIEEMVGVFIASTAYHGIDVNDALSRREARRKYCISGPGWEMRQVIKEGFGIWKDADPTEERFRMARVRFRDGGLSDAGRCLNPG